MIATLLVLSGLKIETAAASDSRTESYPVYAMGIEDFSGQDFSKFKSLQEMPSNMVFGIQATSLKSGGKSSTKAVTKTTKAENQESLKKTLESFQDAMRGLCISEIELNLGFSVSAKSWVVVNEEVAASAKIILGESSYV